MEVVRRRDTIRCNGVSFLIIYILSRWLVRTVRRPGKFTKSQRFYHFFQEDVNAWTKNANENIFLQSEILHRNMNLCYFYMIYARL